MLRETPTAVRNLQREPKPWKQNQVLLLHRKPNLRKQNLLHRKQHLLCRKLNLLRRKQNLLHRTPTLRKQHLLHGKPNLRRKQELRRRQR